MIVDKESSMLGYPQEHSIPLNADHHTVCKFSSTEDSNYRSLVSVLKTLITQSYKDGKLNIFQLKSKHGPELYLNSFLGQKEDVSKCSTGLQKLEKLLGVVTTPYEDLHALQDRLTTGTCASLLERNEFKDWKAKSPSRKILWMHGDPGSGKSIKSSFLINHLVETGEQCHYFFLKHNDIARRSSSALFRSLAFQTAQDIAAYRSALERIADAGKPLNTTDSRQLGSTLFESELSKLKFTKPIFWIIDGLDESESATQIISSISKIPASVPLRVLLTSRKLPAISTALNRAATTSEVVDINVDDNQRDIRIHLEKEATYMRGSSRFQQDVVNQVAQRAEGSFLWASLAMQECLESQGHVDIERIFDEIPSGMEALYRRMEFNIAKLTRDSEKSLARAILIWTTYGRRPLHRDELLRVLRSSSIHDLSASISQVCGHFVTVDRSNRVTLIHQTAREYLMQASNLPFTFDPSTAHQELFSASLQTLLDPKLRSQLGQKVVPTFCSYAASAWPYHLGRAKADSEQILSQLVGFLSGPSVLSWIEALGVLKQLKDLVYASNMLAAFVRRRRKIDVDKIPLSHRLSDLSLVELWAADLIKLVGKYGRQLIQDPSTIYRMVPAFCPTNSALYKQFAGSPLSQISVKGLSGADWDDLLSRISIGPSIRAMMVVCSDQYIALSTSKKSVLVHDAETFEHLRSLYHGEHIYRVAFNKSGQLIASYGRLTTKVWKAATGEQTLNAPNLHASKALELAFIEQDSALLVCTDLRKAQKLFFSNSTQGWQDVYPGVFEESSAVPGAVRNSPTTVVLNDDASQLLVAYRGAPLEAWNLNTSRLIKRCKRRQRADTAFDQLWTGVNRVSWHPETGDVLGIYTDGTVFKWHPVTEVHLELPNVSDTGPSEIQISPDGITFITSDVKGTIRLYSFDDFACIYQLSSEDAITGLCFTADSRRFLDIRGPCCNIWEPNALIRIYETDDRTTAGRMYARSISVVSVPISEARADSTALLTHVATRRQGTLICSGDGEGSVILHDINNSSRVEVETSKTEIERMTWGQDGNAFAYETMGGTLSVYAVEGDNDSTRHCHLKQEPVMRTTSKLESSGSRQLLINHDSTLVLLADGNAVEIWDILPGQMSAKHDFAPADFRIWCNHPRVDDEVLVIKGTDITTCTWKRSGLQRKHKWSIKDTSTASRNNGEVQNTEEPLAKKDPDSAGRSQKDETPLPCKIDKVMVSASREYLLLISSRQSMRLQAANEPLVRFIRSADLDPSSSEIRTLFLPPVIAGLVERPLTVLGRNRFVFIDTTFWICTWRLDLHSGPMLGDKPDSSSVYATGDSAEELEKVGVTRHFFLPRDWMDANSLGLCTILDDGTFLCPRKGEVAVITSGLGSEW